MLDRPAPFVDLDEYKIIDINPPDPHLESIDGDNFRLVETYSAKLAYMLREVQCEIPAGFVSDLASIPRVVRWKYDRASLGFLAVLIHDYLCKHDGVFTNLQGRRVRLGSMAVHAIFLILMLIDGIPPERAFECFVAVVVFGGKWKATDPID